MLQSGGTKYEPTEDDKLWLLRAVQAEGAPQLGVARALVNRFMMLRASNARPLHQTLAAFVRAYAQPVNSRWFPDGELFLSKTRTPLEVQQATLRRDAHSKRNTFDDKVRASVARALSTPFMSDVTDYAVPSLDGTKKGLTARGEPIKGENRFWTARPGWLGYFTSGSSVALVLFVAAVALAAWGRHG